MEVGLLTSRSLPGFTNTAVNKIYWSKSPCCVDSAPRAFCVDVPATNVNNGKHFGLCD